MALGLGFNKAKILQTAEKYVLQGKLPAAIDEYRKILKKDPKDLMTLNTVGDLLARSGKIDEATQCFYELAEKSIEAGFVPRAIAVYKRVTKIDQEALPALTRLGELYSMQGLMRDARAHYLQAVEIHMRRRDPVKAREIFEKILMLDMENPRLQRRMAELYAETGKKAEAVATYLSAAERFLDTKDPAEASTTLETLLKLEPENAEAQVLRGQVLLEQGNSGKAIEVLQAMASRGIGQAALNSLFRAYLTQGNLERASEVAQQIFEKHEDFSCLAQASAEMAAKGNAEGALRIYQGAAEKLQARGAFSVVTEGLEKILRSDPSNIAALELLWGVYRKTGDIGEGRGTAELLAHAYVTTGQLPQARDVYAELVALEPDVVDHQRLLKQVEAQLGSGTGEMEMPLDSTAEPTPLLAMEIAAAPEEESTRVGTLPPREQAIVKNCLTESELYLTYKQLPRAIETLEKGLQEVPGDASLYEHLLPLYEQAQQYAKAAKCAESLTEIYVKLGDGERAARYGELIASYQQKAPEGVSESVVEAAFDRNELETADAAPAETREEQPQVREIDLSMEWASLSESSAPAASEPTAESTAEEIEFYLQAGLVNEAAAAIGRLRESSPEHPSLANFDERLAALLPGTTAFVEEAHGGLVAEPAAEMAASPQAPTAEEVPAETLAAVPEPASPEVMEPEAEAAPVEAPAMTPPLAAAEPEPEWLLDDVFQAKRPATSPSGFELSLEELHHPAAPPAGAAPPDQFASLAGELGGKLPAAASGARPTPAGAKTAPAGGFLDDVFAEFKEDVGEAAAAGDDDLETHYNMGVAFKEMALYDEAIGEFQKVHQLAESAKDYSHVVQCCSLLATCFLEKGMPQLAAQWYQTAI
ncbi:MAG: tetratricopeptide repeat protein, partial [Acidobacteria bacterium]|nr:tetratricopeptide repeat protein [Acidobacteriota bacterium]